MLFPVSLQRFHLKLGTLKATAMRIADIIATGNSFEEVGFQMFPNPNHILHHLLRQTFLR